MTYLDESWWARVLGGPNGELHVGSSSERYVVLPRASDPRVVVDSDDTHALREAVERFVGKRASRGVRSIAGGASAVLSRRRPVWFVDSPDGTLREYLSDVLETEVRLSISVGPVRPSLKPVVRCYSDSKLIAVAKMGPDPHTAAMVANEARWLDAMAADPLPGTSTPPLLHRGQYGGTELLVTRSLDLVSDIGIPFADVPNSAIRNLADRFVDSGPVRDSEWFLGLRRRLDRPDLASLAAQAATIQDDPVFDDLAISAWHGDWSPWNMGQLRSGKLCIWDWERAAIGVPTGFDIAHLHFQYGDGVEKASPGLEEIGVPASHHNVLMRLYLLELCARHAEADALHTDLHTSVLTALDALRVRSGA